jgi:hypothetical protein
MCDPTGGWLTAAGTALSAYGGKRQADRAQVIQGQQFVDQSSRRNDEFSASMALAQQEQEASQKYAEAGFSSQLNNSHRQGVLFNERLVADEKAFQEETEARNIAVDPVNAIADAAANAGAITKAQDKLTGVLDASEASGGQEIGASEGFGTVSEDYASSASEAKTSNISKAKTRAALKGTGAGIGNLQRENAADISGAGFDSNLLRAKTGRDETFSNQVLNRQEQLNQMLFDIDNQSAESTFGLEKNQATIDNALAPDEIKYYDPNNRSAQLYSMLGTLVSLYGSTSGVDWGSLFGNGTQGLAAVNANPSFINQYASFA